VPTSSRLRQSAVSVARKLGILPTLEYARFLKAASTSFVKNRKFMSERPDDYVLPPIWIAYDAYNNLDFANIYSQGKTQAEVLVSYMRKFSAPERQAKLSVLEWGCGPGRIIQHMPRMLGSEARIFGSDYNHTTVDWCQGNLQNLTCKRNQLEPPLAFSAESMDVIYAISVFTHLSDRLHSAWCNELFRVLRPGGLLLVTLHGNAVADKLTPQERETFDRGELVVRGQVKEGSRLYAAFHPDAYARNQLFKDFEVLDKREPFSAGMKQTLWIVRKPEISAAKA
jgi:SAM-dependent methyltransferase